MTRTQSATRRRFQKTLASATQAKTKLRNRADSLPFVFSNFAMTADGKIAFADHRFTPFASERDREHMMELRATADAVMSGARTVDLSPATLGPGGAKYRRERLRRGLREYNLRIIVSGSGSVDSNAEIFKYQPRANGKSSREQNKSSKVEKLSPLIVLTTQRASPAKLRQLRQLADDVKVCGVKQIDFRAAFRWLKKKWKVNRLLCEGGGELHGALIRSGLVDEIHLTISPQIFGGRTAPTLADGEGFSRLVDAAQFELKSTKRFGDEMFFIFRRAKRSERTKLARKKS